jgi:DNA polymerase-3 subunit beta
LSKEEKNITIGVGDSTYKARLIEGVFPSVSKIIDTPCENAIEINKKAFLEALNRAELIVATEAKPTIKMAIENGVLKLTTRGAVAGSGYEEVEVQQKNQTNISVVFNVRYLQSLVKNINTTKMVMQFNTETMPFLLKEENNNNNIFVVLPIKS